MKSRRMSHMKCWAAGMLACLVAASAPAQDNHYVIPGTEGIHSDLGRKIWLRDTGGDTEKNTLLEELRNPAMADSAAKLLLAPGQVPSNPSGSMLVKTLSPDQYIIGFGIGMDSGGYCVNARLAVNARGCTIQLGLFTSAEDPDGKSIRLLASMPAPVDLDVDFSMLSVDEQDLLHADGLLGFYDSIIDFPAPKGEKEEPGKRHFMFGVLSSAHRGGTEGGFTWVGLHLFEVRDASIALVWSGPFFALDWMKVSIREGTYTGNAFDEMEMQLTTKAGEGDHPDIVLKEKTKKHRELVYHWSDPDRKYLLEAKVSRPPEPQGEEIPK
jgi:hypothetical protein